MQEAEAEKGSSGSREGKRVSVTRSGWKETAVEIKSGKRAAGSVDPSRGHSVF